MTLVDAITRAHEMFRASMANPKPFSRDLITAWEIALTAAGIDADDVMQGAGMLLKSSKFFPSPAELIQAVVGDVTAAEELAWQKVRALIAKIGTDATWYSTDLDPKTLWAVERMTLEVLGNMTDEDRPFRRQEFGRLYRAAVASGMECHKIKGWFERMNECDARPLTPATCGRLDLKAFPELPEQDALPYRRLA